ncbi:MAG: hypothetical protein U0271_42620, partial [Polyangiaceae bacterium]
MIHLPDDATWFEGESPLRFDDITQDGRIVPGALMPGLGATTWPALIGDPSTRALLSNGIIPILSRLEIEAADGPFGVA